MRVTECSLYSKNNDCSGSWCGLELFGKEPERNKRAEKGMKRITRGKGKGRIWGGRAVGSILENPECLFIYKMALIPTFLRLPASTHSTSIFQGWWVIFASLSTQEKSGAMFKGETPAHFGGHYSSQRIVLVCPGKLDLFSLTN